MESQLSLKGAQPQVSVHVYCGHTAGWMKTPLGMEVDLCPYCRPRCIRRGLSSPRKGHSSLPLFSDHVYYGHGRPSQLLLSSCSLAVFVHCQNSASCCLISSIFFDSRLIPLLYDSPNLVINAFSLRLLECTVQEKISRERCSSWTVLHAQSTRALSSGFALWQGNAKALYR